MLPIYNINLPDIFKFLELFIEYCTINFDEKKGWSKLYASIIYKDIIYNKNLIFLYLLYQNENGCYELEETQSNI